MSEQLKNAAKAVNDLKKVMGAFAEIENVTNLAQDILPKEKFPATIDGHQMEVSIGLSGQCILFNFSDKQKCESLFRELQQQKQGLFSRIFKK